MRKLLITTMIILSACKAGDDYKQPDLGLSSDWQGKSEVAENQKKDNKEWWKSFKDEKLNKLVDEAIANNQTRKIAEARIEEARASRAGSRSGLFPTLDLSASAERSKEAFFTGGTIRNLYEVGFDANYEIDLFGGTRRKIEAGDALIEATEADYEDITLSLVAEVVREYTNYRQLHKQKEIAQNNIDSWAGVTKLTQTLSDSGLVNGVEKARAENLYRLTRARLPDVEKALTASGHRLSVLLGEQPGRISEDLKEVTDIPTAEELPALSAPADVIARRPDVKSAERELAANTALTGSAISEMYPKINLGAFFGLQDTSMSSGGTAWSFGTGLAAPILNFGRIESEIDASKAREKQAFYTYKQTVIEAVAEVETALSNYGNENRKRKELEIAAENNMKARDLIREQFNNGIAGQIDVLDAEIKYNDTLIELTNSRALETVELVALYKSLGQM